MMIKSCVGHDVLFRGLLVIAFIGSSIPVAWGETYRLEFFKPGDDESDCGGQIQVANTGAKNTRSSCKGTLTIDGDAISLNGTHWWPPEATFYSVTLAGKTSEQDSDYQAAYVSLLVSFEKVTAPNQNRRWGIGGQALLTDEDGRKRQYLVVGVRR